MVARRRRCGNSTTPMRARPRQKASVRVKYDVIGLVRDGSQDLRSAGEGSTSIAND